jgi:UDPglucose--hexose-1-phosphate uridylyltransferase
MDPGQPEAFRAPGAPADRGGNSARDGTGVPGPQLASSRRSAASQYHPEDSVSEQSNFIREIRTNPIVPTESVLIATARGMRPKKSEEPAPRDTRKRVDTCPFCPGNEDKTPPAIVCYPNEADWAVRIVENLYPVLGDDRRSANLSLGLQQIIDGYGRHEVIIDHHSHGIAVHEMSERHLTLLFGAYRDRMAQLYQSNPQLRYVLVFKNFGPAAGASISHTHSQIIATPVVPHNVQAEVDYSRAYYAKNHQCIFCALIDQALTFEATVYDRESGEVRRKINVGQYVVERGEKFIAIKPFASRFEWEVHILPLHHQSDFLDVGPNDLADLARVMRRTMARLDAVLGGAQYNFFLHSLPHADGDKDCHASYHWHMEICPRTSIPTGFELGSGLFVNTVSPEDAAEQLRAVALTDDG